MNTVTITATSSDYVGQPRVNEVYEPTEVKGYFHVVTQVGSEKMFYQRTFSSGIGWLTHAEEILINVDKFMATHKHIGWLHGWFRKELKLK